jgi:hypothetical protein
MIWKGCGRSGRGLILGPIPTFAWRAWGKSRKLCRDIRSSGRDLNPGPLEYETGLLTTRPRLSIMEMCAVRGVFNNDLTCPASSPLIGLVTKERDLNPVIRRLAVRLLQGGEGLCRDTGARETRMARDLYRRLHVWSFDPQKLPVSVPFGPTHNRNY